MIGLYISLGISAFLFALFLLLSYFAYRKTFFSDRRKKRDPYSGIDKKGYKPYEARLRELIDNIISLPFEKIEITSRDGLKLSARYYHLRDGAPLLIQCHGYRSTPLRDFAINAETAQGSRFNLLLIDQRAHGESEGKIISFGIKERFDVQDWINYSIERFGQDLQIILYGISMGGATVLMAAGLPLPQNVKCVIADCPYSSPLEIITKVGAESRLPRFLVKALSVAGARLFGGFSLTSDSPVSAAKRAKIPMLLIHGEADTFVPDYMSDAIYGSNTEIRLEKIAGAEHAVCYLADTERYLAILDNFIGGVLGEKI